MKKLPKSTLAFNRASDQWRKLGAADGAVNRDPRKFSVDDARFEHAYKDGWRQGFQEYEKMQTKQEPKP